MLRRNSVGRETVLPQLGGGTGACWPMLMGSAPSGRRRSRGGEGGLALSGRKHRTLCWRHDLNKRQGTPATPTPVPTWLKHLMQDTSLSVPQFLHLPQGVIYPVLLLHGLLLKYNMIMALRPLLTTKNIGKVYDEAVLTKSKTINC